MFFICCFSLFTGFVRVSAILCAVWRAQWLSPWYIVAPQASTRFGWRRFFSGVCPGHSVLHPGSCKEELRAWTGRLRGRCERSYRGEGGGGATSGFLGIAHYAPLYNYTI